MTSYDDLEYVKVERDGNVLVISLNRPDARNAINGDLSRDIHAALHRVATDTEARAVLLRGEGKSFCVGGDVKMFDERQKEADPPSPAVRALGTLRGTELIDLLLAIPQPTVAAVQGHAMGLGSTLALFCDVVIAAEDAWIAGQPCEHRLGRGRRGCGDVAADDAVRCGQVVPADRRPHLRRRGRTSRPGPARRARGRAAGRGPEGGPIVSETCRRSPPKAPRPRSTAS